MPKEDRDTKLRSTKERVTTELGLVQMAEYATEDVPDVIQLLQALDEAVRNEGALKAFTDLFEDTDVEDVK